MKHHVAAVLGLAAYVVLAQTGTENTTFPKTSPGTGGGDGEGQCDVGYTYCGWILKYTNRKGRPLTFPLPKVPSSLDNTQSQTGATS